MDHTYEENDKEKKCQQVKKSTLKIYTYIFKLSQEVKWT